MKRIKKYIDALDSPPRYGDLQKEIKSVLKELTETGDIKLGDDKDLSGEALETRTKLLFKKLGFQVEEGRPNLEDLIVKPISGIKIDQPLVVEVKSSGKQNINRDDLRQLDDWIFDLSGEETARKDGLGGGFDPLSHVTLGLLTTKQKHPTPHKGVFVFNGPVGVDFALRSQNCFNENDRDFIEKRNICIVPFGVLVEYEEAFENDPSFASLLWERLHVTTGMIEKPDRGKP